MPPLPKLKQSKISNQYNKGALYQMEKSSKEIIELEIQGMTCESCAGHVTQALRSVKGIVDINVPGWRAMRATIVTSGQVKDHAIKTAIEKAGYKVDVRKRTTLPPQISGSANISYDYDLAIIGTGGAGMAAAIKGAELGQSVIIIEGGTVGGTCVNNGCIPSKTLIRAAETFHNAGNHSFKGVNTKAEKIDWKMVMQQKEGLVSNLRQSKYLDVLASYGENITLLQGQARLEPEGIIVIDGKKRLRAKKIVIATGARPKILSLATNVEVLTSTSVMELEELPESLVIIGGRAIALELGQMLARFGVKITILQRSDQILPDHEPELSNALMGVLQKEGLQIHTNVKLIEITQTNNSKVVTANVDGKTHEFRSQAILMTVGKTPNTLKLGLTEIGVQTDAQGFIIVDEFLQTSNPQIYAAGDVTTHPKFVYVAAKAGGLTAENALTGNRRRFDLSALPSVIFTDPQMAKVGLTEAEAKKQGFDVKTTLLSLDHVPRALAAQNTSGMIKLIADASSDRLLGAHILAAEGGEVIQAATLIVKFGNQYGATVSDLVDSFFPYLVQVEGLKLAAQSFDKDVSKLSCCAG